MWEARGVMKNLLGGSLGYPKDSVSFQGTPMSVVELPGRFSELCGALGKLSRTYLGAL